jgi:hypothetical protein
MTPRLVLVGALLAFVASVSHAQADWNSLSSKQRSVLAPLQRDWSQVSPSQQQKWMQLADRYDTLPTEDKARTQQRMGEWSRLTPQERARARVNYQEASRLGREERQQQWEAYRALPAERRRELAESARPGAPASARPANGGEPANVKSNVVRAPAVTPARPVGPTVVQRGPGATTSLVSKPAAPPLHQQAGLPKVAATPGFVDGATLLPRRGAQGAAVRSPGAEAKDGKAQPPAR